MAQREDGRPAEPAPPAGERRLFESRADVVQFGRAVVRRFLADLCLERAAALSYTSVVSLVPAAAVSLAFLSALPQTGALRADVEGLLMQYLLPTAGETAVDAFRTFVGKAAGLSVLGFAGLAVTAVMLLITVNAAFDTIWRVHRPRPWLIRLIAYGAVLTAGPLLIGIALSISGLLLATGERYAGAAFTWSVSWVTPLVPLLLEAAAFTLLYRAVPNCRVMWRDSLAGGVAAALLFEGAKHGFALYIVWFPTYNAIYGAVAAIPVLLAWIYLCWIATLVGAELAATLPEWRKRVTDGADGS
ncbi:MAG TPA: YihY family inner membrane protein [Candidatus Acidoferrum sp.]|nr:YihY family inner membrane protein [Candidatus Acidoferrum sp.]